MLLGSPVSTDIRLTPVSRHQRPRLRRPTSCRVRLPPLRLLLAATLALLGEDPCSQRDRAMSASLIGRLRSSAFRLSTTAASASLAGSCFSSESAQGPSSMGSEDKVEQSLGRPCPMTGPSGHANSPHPSSREGRHSTAWWSSKYPPIAFDPERTSYRCSSSGPSELAAISPDAVHISRCADLLTLTACRSQRQTDAL